MVGIKKGWEESSWKIVETGYEEDILHIRKKDEEGNLNIILIYNRRYKSKEVGEAIAKITERFEKEYIIVGGDFNIRTGELGREENEGGVERKNKDRIINNGGDKFIGIMQEKGLNILNGKVESDWEGEFTYVRGRDSTVIDYVFANEPIMYKIVDFRVKERVDSDHMPICVRISREQEVDRRYRGRTGEEEAQKEKKVICWDIEAIKSFIANTEETGWIEEQEERSLDFTWKKLKELVDKAMIKKDIRIKTKRIGFKEWWDKRCTKMKRDTKKSYKKWKSDKISRQEYLEQKKEWRRYMEKKKIEKREEEEKTLKRIRTEAEVWKFINKRRKKRETRETNLEVEEWRKHFVNLLEGQETLEEEENKGSEEWEKEDEQRKEKRQGDDPSEEEIRKVVKKMKMKKAARIDGIPMEAWKLGGETVKKGIE
ncbi:trichohyalin-like [Pseudomyrmex gracilis]|uniref:trichohyalin-like n=1 Tax=Pseudomyrmex gracilis TaxID=219809 RepID=UPI0009953452|nr:trichohyalin-like [Pseudomyrmex gracilis]